MSSDTTGESADVTPQKNSDESASTEKQDGDSTPVAGPLKIELPDGSESVSDAILSHREMLQAPDDNGLATEEEITHLTEAIESLSAEVQETGQQLDETQADVDEVKDTVARQQQQIEELQSAVNSLAEILGTSTEWRRFDEDETDN
jgi:peptidoglycan hydrolase CwlO-like protein